MKKAIKARAFLNQVLAVERRMDAALQKVALCQSLTQRVTSSLSNEQVSRTRNVASNQDAILNLIEAKAAAQKATKEYLSVVDQTLKVLTQLKDPADQQILTAHYIKHVPFENISIDMKICKATIYNHHRRALEEIEALLNCPADAQNELDKNRLMQTNLD